MIECKECGEPATIFSTLTESATGRKRFYAECEKHYVDPWYDGAGKEFWYLSEQDWLIDQLKERL